MHNSEPWTLLLVLLQYNDPPPDVATAVSDTFARAAPLSLSPCRLYSHSDEIVLSRPMNAQACRPTLWVNILTLCTVYPRVSYTHRARLLFASLSPSHPSCYCLHLSNTRCRCHRYNLLRLSRLFHELSHLFLWVRKFRKTVYKSSKSLSEYQNETRPVHAWLSVLKAQVHVVFGALCG